VVVGKVSCIPRVENSISFSTLDIQYTISPVKIDNLYFSRAFICEEMAEEKFDYNIELSIKTSTYKLRLTLKL
jgi:hypothetical protein